MWKIRRESHFTKQYKLLGRERQKRVDSALLDLTTAENPTQLGEYKPNLRIFAYELGKGDRIIYTIDYQQNTIILIRVCGHKSVYGKD